MSKCSSVNKIIYYYATLLLENYLILLLITENILNSWTKMYNLKNYIIEQCFCNTTSFVHINKAANFLFIIWGFNICSDRKKKCEKYNALTTFVKA